MTVSILLYFFVLAVFGWMLCEGIIIYLQLVNVYTGLGLGGRHLKVFYIIGWGELCKHGARFPNYKMLINEKNSAHLSPLLLLIIRFSSFYCVAVGFTQ